MPHVIVKLWPGKSDADKRDLADAIVRDLTTVLGYGPQSVSVGFEEIGAGDWTVQVYGPDIQDKWDTLVKKPGYGSGPKTAIQAK